MEPKIRRMGWAAWWAIGIAAVVLYALSIGPMVTSGSRLPLRQTIR